VRGGSWATSAALAFGHGANDAQKSVGVIAALFVADGRATGLTAPAWTPLVCAAALTAGTALGGWRIVRTIGQGIFHLHPLDGVAAQSASAGVLVAASALGAPVSTTQVVASSILGVGGGRRRWRHVRWTIVRQMGLGWVVTLPATALLAGVLIALWSALP
jgi:PiT family inorganic phosphate transporter